MANPYSIPFQPPDLSSGASLLLGALQQSRANDRSDEYLGMQRDAMRRSAERESHEVERQKEADKYKRAVEAWNALPALQRAAFKSPGMANANPYGVKFEQETAPRPSIGDVDIMGAKDNAYGKRAQEALSAPLPPRGLEAGEEGPELDPQAEAMRFGDELETPEEPSAGMSAAHALLGQPQAKRMFATFQGQRFEVPERKETTPFGAEYDAIYQGLLEAGEKPHDALKLVSAQYKSDQSQKAIADRVSSQITSRETLARELRPDVATQDEWLNRRLAQSEKNARIGAQSRVAAASPGLKADAANARDLSVLERAGSAIRQTGQFSKLAASDKTVRSIFANIANGSTPLQHKDAQIQLARFFRQAQPTEGEMHMLYNNLGGTMDKWNQFIAKLTTGDLSPEQMRQLKASSKAVRKEHDEDVSRFVNVMRARLGPGGGFDLMPDQAQKLYESMGAELGLEHLPPLYDVTGGVTLGSGKRPTVQPRGKNRTALDEVEAQLDAMGVK